jgi:hypothetical protein
MGARSTLHTGIETRIQWVRARGRAPRAIVFAPPLIGGHALQQIRMLRSLVPRGFDLVSFSYAGHGASSGVFSFQAALDNCIAILDWAHRRSCAEGLPLYGIASCFGALPMIHAVVKRNEPLDRMALINAVPNWRWEKLFFDFVRRWSRSNRGWLSMAGLRAAMDQYLRDYFPRVHHRKRSFGILSTRRMIGALWHASGGRSAASLPAYFPIRRYFALMVDRTGCCNKWDMPTGRATKPPFWNYAPLPASFD